MSNVTLTHLLLKKPQPTTLPPQQQNLETNKPKFKIKGNQNSKPNNPTLNRDFYFKKEEKHQGLLEVY